jgi:hypothetical protein
LQTDNSILAIVPNAYNWLIGIKKKDDCTIYKVDSTHNKITRTHLKNVDQGSWQGAVRRKSAAYTLVCEHFEPIRNTAMST